MNIFVVNNDPVLAARDLCDKHINKMCSEGVQMLSCAHRMLDGELRVVYLPDKGKWRKTWVHWSDTILDDSIISRVLWLDAYHNHPCTLWARSSKDNYRWLYQHTAALQKQFRERYNKPHATEQVMYLLKQAPVNLLDVERTPHVVCMPDEYKCGDVVDSYRTYYKQDKSSFAKWEQGVSAPDWFSK